jgi:hypothetical protein
VKVVAALYVEADGPYAGLQGVDAWSIERDARRYNGPHAVVAHPPCKRWGRYWSGGPSASVRRNLGDDEGCFAAALYAVRTFGGVIEHPAGSAACEWFGLPMPPRLGWGWSKHADKYGGRSCVVTQGRYGHRARKLTWLYAVLPAFPTMDTRDFVGVRLEDGFHTNEERRAARARGVMPVKRLSQRERICTPVPFRDALLDMARSC